MNSTSLEKLRALSLASATIEIEYASQQFHIAKKTGGAKELQPLPFGKKISNLQSDADTNQARENGNATLTIIAIL